MTGFIKKWQVIAAIGFFVFIVIIGLLAGVSTGVAISRGAGWAAVIFIILIPLSQQAGEMVLSAQPQSPDAEITEEDEEAEEDLKDEQLSKTDLSSENQMMNDVEAMIRANPERAAEITRTMGVD